MKKGGGEICQEKYVQLKHSLENESTEFTDWSKRHFEDDSYALHFGESTVEDMMKSNLYFKAGQE